MYNVTGGQGCLDGDLCPFAHSPYQLARPKSYLCPSKAGYCRGRGRCPFAHDEKELEKSPMPVIKRLCKYLCSAHGCNLGDGCRNAHSQGEVVSGIRLAGSNRIDPNNDYVLSLYHGDVYKNNKKPSRSLLRAVNNNNTRGLRIESLEPLKIHSPLQNGLPLSHPSLSPVTPRSHSSSDITTPNACQAPGVMHQALLESVAAGVVENQGSAAIVADIYTCLSFLISAGFRES